MNRRHREFLPQNHTDDLGAIKIPMTSDDLPMTSDDVSDDVPTPYGGVPARLGAGRVPPGGRP
jgi:hypothetical protein